MDESHVLLSELPTPNYVSMDENHLLCLKLPHPIACPWWIRVICYCPNCAAPMACPWMRVIDYCNRFLNSPTDDREAHERNRLHTTHVCEGTVGTTKTKRCCIWTAITRQGVLVGHPSHRPHYRQAKQQQEAVGAGTPAHTHKHPLTFSNCAGLQIQFSN
jgi:hypothetical protein